ncbi:MAG TPA: RidA family protein [Candidatus Avidehalobacter gallistercoris]|uniref:RidA family protein n=1 Tax=Candidatus Avidehalobacter gallistercoris TaxID=2840694 RepID=A0A9D1HN78_9FIRM|nr:RidA family protein [Candidatus Avidehalobacter gallistercoris]
MTKKRIVTDKAPAALGPYSQAIAAGGMLYASGQVPVDPATGELAGADIETQARQVFENLKQVLQAAGADFGSVVKTTVFLTDLANFGVVNDIYAEYFTEPYPARSCVQISALPKGALIEAELIAEL